MTLQEINSAIISGTFTNEDLTSIIDAIKFARARIAERNKCVLGKGSIVKFTSSRSGKVVTGTVEKVNRKFVIVRENGMISANWRVPANMLTIA